jgi:peroxiredoxin
MEALYQKFRAKGLAVVAISLDEQGAKVVRPFLEKYKLTFPVALDPESKISRVYGAGNLPSTFLINREGSVVAAAKGERDWYSPDVVSYIVEVLGKAPTITTR